MPEDKSISMTRNGVTKEVSPELYKYALSKGWARKDQGVVTPQAKSPVQRTPEQQQMAQPGGGAVPTQGSAMARFGQGFGQGINPFHTPPDNMAVPGTMGTMGNAGADMLNMRETMNKSFSGDKAGALGMAAGTGAGLMGPELLKGVGKGMKALGLSSRAAEEIPRVSSAAKKAVGAQKELKGGIGEARLAERYVQPLREALDKKFETLHQAMAQQIIPLSTRAKQVVKRMASKADIPAIQKLGEEMTQRSALDYREADKLVSELRGMKHTASHWFPQVMELSNAVESEIDKSAKSLGLDAIRNEYKADYKELMDVRNAIATTAKTKVSRLRPIVDFFTGHSGVDPMGVSRVGARVGHEAELKVGEVGKAGAKKMGKKLGVNESKLEQGLKPNMMEKAGTGLHAASAGAQIAPIYRFIYSLINQQPPQQ